MGGLYHELENQCGEKESSWSLDDPGSSCHHTVSHILGVAAVAGRAASLGPAILVPTLNWHLSLVLPDCLYLAVTSE